MTNRPEYCLQCNKALLPREIKARYSCCEACFQVSNKERNRVKEQENQLRANKEFEHFMSQTEDERWAEIYDFLVEKGFRSE